MSPERILRRDRIAAVLARADFRDVFSLEPTAFEIAAEAIAQASITAQIELLIGDWDGDDDE